MYYLTKNNFLCLTHYYFSIKYLKTIKNLEQYGLPIGKEELKN